MPSLPILTSYIDSLPEGLASYPTLVQKCAITHSLLSQWPEARSHASLLPPTLQALLTDTPPSNVWIPEAHGMAMWLFAADVLCGGDAGAFRDFSMKVNRSLMQSPVYRMIFGTIGGRLTVRAIGVAWSSFHRGVEQVLTVDSGVGNIEIRFPKNLIAEALAPSYGAAYEAGLEVAGIKNPKTTMLDISPTSIRYQVTWTT